MASTKILKVCFCLAVAAAAGLYAASWMKHHPKKTFLDEQNISYTIEGQQVTLVKGISEVASAPGSASMTTTKYFGNEATGDLNGDGIPDVAFLLTQDSGGSGTFYYVVAALKTRSGYVGTNAVFLGDRIAPQTTEIRNGEAIVNFATRNANDAMTVTPSIGATKYLKVTGTTLAEVPAESSAN